MTVVLDTSVLIDHLRGDERARRALTAVRAENSTPSASVLTTIEWLDVDDDLAERAGTLAARFVRSHPGIEVVDFVIAATAERLEARLLTRNRKHFPMFADLGDPYEPDGA